VDVVVTNPDAQSDSLPDAFLYVAAPTLVSVVPASGPQAGGTDVTLSGQDFQPGAGVTFGGISATDIVVITSGTISATTPVSPASGYVDVVVTNPDAQSGSLPGGFLYEEPPPPPPPPTLSSVVPASGPQAGGTSVILSGKDFQPGAQVLFGGISATDIVVVGSTTIQAKTPASAVAEAVNVTVINPDAQADTLSGGFLYTAP
jgi:hypothetical protein